MTPAPPLVPPADCRERIRSVEADMKAKSQELGRAMNELAVMNGDQKTQLAAMRQREADNAHLTKTLNDLRSDHKAQSELLANEQKVSHSFFKS